MNRQPGSSKLNYQGLVDTHLVEGELLDHAAIVDHDTWMVMGKTTGFPEFSVAELESILSEFNNPGTHPKLSCGGTDYKVGKGSNKSLIRAYTESSDKEGVIIMKTTSFLVIGIYTNNPEKCCKIVQELGNHLLMKGV